MLISPPAITPSSPKINQAGLPALGIYGGAQTCLAQEAKGLWDAQNYQTLWLCRWPSLAHPPHPKSHV